MRSRRAASIVFALALALAAVGFDATTASAATDQLQDKAVSTYELQPARGVIHVTIAFTLTNKAPDKSSSHHCSRYVFYPGYGYILVTGTCTTRTYYYYDSYKFWVERDARAFKAKANSGSAKVKLGKTSGDYRNATLKFSQLLYGKTRNITVSYDLPAGGPRTTTERKAGFVYASFCADGPGTDKGSLRVVVPQGFAMSLTSPMSSKTTGGTTVYSTGELRQPWKFQSCFKGSDPTGYALSPSTIDSGPTVSVESWKEDKAWADAVKASVESDLPALARTLGVKALGPKLIIREERADTIGLDRYDPATGIVTLSEGVTTRADATHRLAGLWFDRHVFGDDWMTEGYADWAEHQAGVSDTPCTEPGAYPTAGKPNLAYWPRLGVHPSATDLAIVAYHQQAACYLMSTLADKIGADRMGNVLGAIRDGTDAFSPTAAPVKRGRLFLSWKDWLDIVQERGLAAAEADPGLATTLLRTYGIASDDAILAAHDTAHDAYHRLLELTGQPAPDAVLTPLRAWDFEAAQTAIASATDAWTTADAVATTLPGVVVDGAAVQQAVTAAGTQADLDGAKTRATQQLTLAKDVAAALALEAAPRDPIQQLGLAGTTLPDGSVAIAAVARGDAQATGAFVTEVRSDIGAARDTGTQRLAVIVAVVVAIILLAVLATILVRRRRRRRRAGSSDTDQPGAILPG